MLKCHEGDVGVSLALLDKSNITRRMKLVDAVRLHRSTDGDLVKLIVRKAFDTTVFDGLDTLSNPNLFREVGIHVHDLPKKFSRK